MVYLINKETNEVIRAFDHIISWKDYYVEYTETGSLCKFYCNSETEYFTDTPPVPKEDLEENIENIE